MLAVLPVVFLIWQPKWLKPHWLQWLEDNYGHVLDDMLAEARRMGQWNWEARVKTQANLEYWADTIAQKQGWKRLNLNQL
jgi:hypothetical protein